MLKQFTVNTFQGKMPAPLLWLSMLALGVIVLMLRNLDPLINPIVLTEDGAWLSMAFGEGWLYTFFNAKDGYFVWGNLILLFAAERSSAFMCGNSLICLPQSIAVFSYLFYSFTATLAWWAAKHVLSQGLAILIFVLMLLMPLGDSSNEIIGRLSNIGYMFVFISSILVFVRSDFESFSRFLIDAFLILCAATNPVCLLIIIMAPLVHFIRHPSEFNVRSAVGDFQVLGIGFIIMVASIAWRIFHAQGTLSYGTFQPHALIEVALARSILYPFIFPWYNYLTDLLTVTITICLLFFLVVIFSLVRSKNVRILCVICSKSFILFWMMTLLMRQNVTEYFEGYVSTWPDRYFMGLNYIILFMFLLLSGSLVECNGFRRIIGAAGLTGIAFIFFIKASWLVEFKEPRMNLATGILFKDQLCFSGMLMNGENEDQKYVVVPVHVQGWKMSVPKEIFQNAVKKCNCDVVLENFFISNMN